MRRVTIWSAAVLMATAITGCAGDDSKPMANLVPVTGTVTFDGKPLEQGRVMLVPEDEKAGQPASGAVTSGNFTVITTVSAPGVVAGKYKVRIESLEGGGATVMPAPGEKPKKPKSLIPEKYGDLKNSGLEAEVKAGMAPLKFELKP